MSATKINPQTLHKAHGGGAWKVAYADFVTAMMALFMVLWISAQDEEIMLSTSRYFQNPFQYAFEDHSSGIMKDGGSSLKGDAGQNKSMVDLNFLHTLASEFMRMLDIQEADPNAPVHISVTADGMRIIVYDRPDNPLFKEGTYELTKWGDFLLENLAWYVDRHTLRVRIDAYTPSRPQQDSGPYQDPWELTTMRANAARKALVHYALNPEKIDRVTGFGDAHPLKDQRADAPINQRVEFSLAVN
jgi:chemotaxis protein MotB